MEPASPHEEPRDRPIASPALPEQLQRGEEVIDRARNLRHLVALQRVLHALRLKRWSERKDAPPPPLSH